MQFYFIVEEGLLKDTLFPLHDQLTIGRSPGNDLNLKHISISRRHAVVRLQDATVILEDLDSHNGTFVNEKRIKSAVLSSGDVVRFGEVGLHFVQSDTSSELDHLLETQEVDADNLVSLPNRRSSRLVEIISKSFPFQDLEEENWRDIAGLGRLVSCDPHKVIIRQGDPGKAFYIIIEGGVRAYINDLSGQEHTIAVLGEKEHFGEISLLTGSPCSTTALALYETLLFELDIDALQEIMKKWPSVRAALERSHQDQAQELERLKREMGIVEQRSVARFNVTVPVRFEVSGKIVHGRSSDISTSGVTVRIHEEIFSDLSIGARLGVKIVLPKPWGSVSCNGIVRSITKQPDRGLCLGMEYGHMKPAHLRKMEHFLQVLVRFGKIGDQTELIEKQLVRSQKLACLGLLVSGASHEIKNLNNCVTFNLPILKEYVQELIAVIEKDHRNSDFDLCGMSYTEFCKDLFRLFENMEHASGRIQSSMVDLREFIAGRARKGQSLLDIREVVDKAVGICRYELKKVKSFELNVPPRLQPILTDPEVIEHVLVNLLTNAVQASDKKDSWIKLGVSLREDQLAVEVCDNGCGMDEETVAEVFEPFFTTKDDEDGTGLGLFVSRSLIAGLGGRMEVESAPGQGSHFKVYLRANQVPQKGDDESESRLVNNMAFGH
jgi:two-component system NtrC family sensor kinase